MIAPVLDFRKIETSSFKLAPEGREGFEITFGTNSHAVLFQRQSKCATSCSGYRSAEGQGHNHEASTKAKIVWHVGLEFKQMPIWW